MRKYEKEIFNVANVSRRFNSEQYKRIKKYLKIRLIIRRLICIAIATILIICIMSVINIIISNKSNDTVDNAIVSSFVGDNNTYNYLDKINDIKSNAELVSSDTYEPVPINEWERITTGTEDQTSMDFQRFICIGLSIWGPEGVYGIDPALLYSVASKGSSFDPYAISEDGHAYGLCQIRDTNFEYLTNVFGREFNAYDVEDSLLAAAYMLNNYIDKYDDLNKALMCYSMGEAGASNLWNQGIMETEYSKSVIRLMNEYTADELF